MGSSPPVTEAPASLSPKSAWSSPPPEVSSSQPKPVFTLDHGVARVSVPEAIVDEGTPLWKNFVVGHFMGDVPHVGTIHATVNRIWNSVGRSTRIDVQILNATTVLFRIDNAQTRSRVLRRRYWHIANIPLVVNEWSPETVHERPDLSAMPLWVDLMGVPGHLYSQRGLRFLADIIGNFVRLHPSTERCTRLDMARVLVEVNLEKALTEKICIEDKQGSEATVTVTYPWLPPRCNVCLKWGHREGACANPRHTSPKDLTVTVGEGESPSEAPKVAEQAPKGNLLGEVKSLIDELGNVLALPVAEAPPGPSFSVDTPNTAIHLSIASQEVTTETTDTHAESLTDQADGWSLITRSGKSSTRTIPGTALESASKAENTPRSPSGFGVLADVPEDGEIVEIAESPTATRGKMDAIVEQASEGTLKNTNKNKVKPKHMRRPILNKLDLIQARPSLNNKNASSRKH